MGGRLRIGMVGVGTISEQYLAAFGSLPNLALTAVADLDRARAAAVAERFGVDVLSVDDLIADPRIDAVLNLTIPAAHIDIDTAAIAAGKHVYAEKPLGLATDAAAQMLRLATDRGVRVGSAPDTVLGTGVQTARAALDSGAIGEPVGAAAFWAAPGHELWHPAPTFYYQPGAGPLFDMGPYYLTTLVTLLGPVVEVSGSVFRSNRERTVATGPSAGTVIPVGVDTHITAMLRHASGVTSTVAVSFEVWGSRAPLIEVFGTAGTLSVPDPNLFDGAVELLTAGRQEWSTVPVSAGYADAGRGFGLADMARAIETGRPHRASGDLALHVLEMMEGILHAGSTRSVVAIRSRVDRPVPVPLGATPDSW